MGKLPNHPTIIPIPFAENGNKNVLPESPASSTSNLASWSYGFPDITRKDKSDGGLPPSGKDFQGIFYTLSEHAYYQQSGGVYLWSNKVNYNVGSIVRIVDSSGACHWFRALKQSGPNIAGIGAKDPASSGNVSYIADDTTATAYWQNVDLVYATTSRTGVVKVGTNIDVANGVISVKTANGSTLGLVKQGTNVTIANGVVSVATANGSTLGLVKQGDYVTISNGVISANKANGTTPGVVYQGNYVTISNGKLSVNLANGTTPGAVKQGSYLTIADGTISANKANSTTPGVVYQGDYVTISSGKLSANIANGNTPGVVKQGTNVAINSDGTVNVATANGSTLGVVKQGNYVTISNGTISANIAKTTASTCGVVYQGSYLTIGSDGKISANKANSTTPGVVYQGNYLTIADGKISANKASGTTPGAVYQGSYVTIASDGKISANKANGTTPGVVYQSTNVKIADGALSVADASTSVKGVVQLSSSTSSTSETLAATAKVVKTVNDSAVHKTGDETISGIKTFTSDYRRKVTSVVKGTTKPSSNVWTNGVRFVDNNNVAMGGIENGYLTDKTNRVNMIVYKGTDATTSSNAQIGVGFDGSGNWFTYAPTPAAASNTTHIATTAWTRTFGNSTYLKLTGGEVTGSIVFGGSASVYDNATLVYNGTPSTNITHGVRYWRDKNNKYVARSIYQKLTDNTMKFCIQLCKHGTINDNGYSTVFTACLDKSGAGYATCPTPPADSNNTKIATTAWVRSRAPKMVPSGNPQSRASGVTYTAETNGFVIVRTANTGGTCHSNNTVTVNGYKYNLKTTHYGKGSCQPFHHFCIPCKSGWKYVGNTGWIVWVPAT